jgi:intein-encoded DNA endonuclease-like protein
MNADTKDRDDQIEKLYTEDRLSYRAIGSKIGVSDSTVHHALKKRGIKRLDLEVYDRNYFKKIDSERKAYVLGFFFADGSVSLKKCSIRLRLAEKDKEILLKIADELKITKPLKYFCQGGRYPSWELAFYGIDVCRDLIDLGCVCSKSDKLVFPKIRKDLVRHFIRGYFDGDGCIAIDYKRKRSHISICSTPAFNESILQFLRDNSKIGGGFYNHKKIKNYCEIDICGMNQSIEFFNLIYKGATIYLQRKFDKFQEVIKINGEKKLRRSKFNPA